MNKYKIILLISVAILGLNTACLTWILKNNINLYDPIEAKEDIEKLNNDPRTMYSKKYVLNLVELKYRGDEAFALKDEGLNDLLTGVTTLVIISIFLHIVAFTQLKQKKHNQSSDPT